MIKALIDLVTPGKQQGQPICSRFPRDHSQNERSKKNASTTSPAILHSKEKQLKHMQEQNKIKYIMHESMRTNTCNKKWS